jgi:hypothetical protein
MKCGLYAKMFKMTEYNEFMLSFLFIFEMGSHCVSQADFELLDSMGPISIASQVAETAGVYHCAGLC